MDPLSGSMVEGYSKYWRKVTTTFDGKLVVSTLSNETLDIDLFLFDQNKETQIASYDLSTGINEATHHDYLSSGTYYIKAIRYSGTGSYTISSQFTPTSLENDTEPNDTPDQARILAMDGSDTGHLKYYLNGSTDSVDWWKVTITSDRKLVVSSLSDETLEIDLFLFDRHPSHY